MASAHEFSCTPELAVLTLIFHVSHALPRGSSKTSTEGKEELTAAAARSGNLEVNFYAKLAADGGGGGGSGEKTCLQRLYFCQPELIFY